MRKCLSTILAFIFSFAHVSYVLSEESKYDFKSAIPLPLFTHFNEEFIDIFFDVHKPHFFEDDYNGSQKAFFYALTRDGRVYVWVTSSNGDGWEQWGYEFKERKYQYEENGYRVVISKVISNDSKSYAIDSLGKVYSLNIVSYNEYDDLYPKAINRVDDFEGIKVVKIIGLLFQFFTITEDGKVYVEGGNACGQLGLGDKEPKDKPTVMSTLSDKSIVDITSSYADISGDKIKDSLCSHTLVLDSNGKVYTWGDNRAGQLGLGHKESTSSPKELPFFKDKIVIQIASGDHFSLVLTKEGKLYSWGSNNKGQLGLGDRAMRLNPRSVKDLKNIVKIYVHDSSCFAFDEDGRTYAWGENQSGQLGVGNKQDTLVPELINVFHVTEIFMASSKSSLADTDNILREHNSFVSSTFALTEEGDVYVWGNNEAGQLGLGHAQEQLSPQYLSRELFFDEDIVKIKSHLFLNSFRIPFLWSGETENLKRLYSEIGDDYKCGKGQGKTCHKSEDSLRKDFKGRVYACTFALTDSGTLYVWGSYHIKNPDMTEEEYKKQFSLQKRQRQYEGLKKNIYALKSSEGQEKLYEKIKKQIKYDLKPRVLQRLKDEDVKKEFQDEAKKKAKKLNDDIELKMKDEL